MHGSIEIDGLEMHYEMLGAERKDDASKPAPLLLLHGFTGAGADWRHVFDLAELARDRAVILPDLRGHGRTRNHLWPLTHRRCAHDVLALLDRLGIDRVDAIGLSLGGNTLLHLATEQPSRVRAMILVSATMYFPESARAIMRQVTAETRSEQEWQEMRGRHVHGDAQIRELWAQARAFADDYEDLSFTPARLSRIEARTLVMNGDEDPLYPPSMTVDMYRAIPSASLWIVPGGGHGPIFGEHRDAFVGTAKRFLA